MGKLPGGLAASIAGFDNAQLDPVNTGEAQLPTDIKAGISNISSTQLRHVNTGTDQLPEDVKGSIEKFEKPKRLSHVDPVEKNVLPTVEALEAEKKEHEFRKGIEDFKKEEALKKVQTEEKNCPSY